MKFLTAASLGLVLGLSLSSCTQRTDHMYAGIVVAYVHGKAIDSHLLGLALTKEKCEAGIKAASAVPDAVDPNDDVRYVLGCAEFVPSITVN